ncbi:MAG: tRNA pseudouridine(55) synthase TruB [Chloroflexota bacterium]
MPSANNAAEPFGFLNIDKPLGLTSHDVVSKVRRAFGIRRVGHAGTLDPLATGVLVVCVGTATRLSEYAMTTVKAYRADVQLGISTTTYDAEGEITSQQDTTHITHAEIEQILPQFIGEIQQVPPVYSAIKKGGKKLYELARAGETVEIEPRAVKIDALTISAYDPTSSRFVLDVVCGSGTYIRSLAHDIGESLGVGAHLAGLVRTQVGNFHLEDAIALENITETDIPHAFLTSVADGLRGLPSTTLTDQQLTDVRHGRRFARPDDTVDLGTEVLAYSENGEFIAVLKAMDGTWKPHKVFSSAS